MKWHISIGKRNMFTIFTIVLSIICWNLFILFVTQEKPLLKTQEYWEMQVSKLEEDVELIEALIKLDTQELRDHKMSEQQQQLLAGASEQVKDLALSAHEEEKQEIMQELEIDNLLLKITREELEHAKSKLTDL